jgi:hypothetical protein
MAKRHPEQEPALSLSKGRRTGENRLKAAIARRRKRSDARSDDPRPYDESWGWWVEEHLARLENGQTWLIRVAITALAAEITRIALAAFGLGG